VTRSMPPEVYTPQRPMNCASQRDFWCAHAEPVIEGYYKFETVWSKHANDRLQNTRCLLLTSKKWRLQSGCNHSTAYVDQWKGLESCEFLTQSSHAALRSGNAHQDLKKSEEIC